MNCMISQIIRNTQESKFHLKRHYNFNHMLKVSEKAIGYFERAALMQPDEVKWQLMIASCYRRSGNYHRALDTYKVKFNSY